VNHAGSAEVAVVIPAGPGKEALLDTLESVDTYCCEEHRVIVVDDCTQDGTYEATTNARRPHWQVLRNPRNQGIERLVHSLCTGFKAALRETRCSLVLRLDQDALIIKPGLIADALEYAARNPHVGLFGIYEVDYNRPRNFENHRRQMCRELAWYRRAMGRQPSWRRHLDAAERNGYERGENVFGGGYFVTRPCLEALDAIGALDVPWHWNSMLQEDVYFSMAAVAAGFRLGHFAAPDGPICMEWRGLPYPAAELIRSRFKLVHSVDKGKNTSAAENGGRTAREVFREARMRGLASARHGGPDCPERSAA
jgi:glycosyltransferase involved in cell wall biosynthesis